MGGINTQEDPRCRQRQRHLRSPQAALCYHCLLRLYQYPHFVSAHLLRPSQGLHQIQLRPIIPCLCSRPRSPLSGQGLSRPAVDPRCIRPSSRRRCCCITTLIPHHRTPLCVNASPRLRFLLLYFPSVLFPAPLSHTLLFYQYHFGHCIVHVPSNTSATPCYLPLFLLIPWAQYLVLRRFIFSLFSLFLSLIFDAITMMTSRPFTV